MNNYLSPLIIIIALTLAGLLYAITAKSAPLFKSPDGTISLRLTESPCTNSKVLGHLKEKIKPEYAGKFKEAKLFYGGKDWASCWLLLNGFVYSLDEEGAPLQPIPHDKFRDDAV